MSGLRFWGVPTIRGGARTDVRPGVRAPEDHAEPVESVVRESYRRPGNRLARALAVHRGDALARNHETDHGPDGRARRAGRRRRSRGRRAAQRRARTIRWGGGARVRARRSERLAGFFRATHAPHLRGGHRAAKVGTPSRSPVVHWKQARRTSGGYSLGTRRSCQSSIRRLCTVGSVCILCDIDHTCIIGYKIQII